MAIIYLINHSTSNLFNEVYTRGNFYFIGNMAQPGTLAHTLTRWISAITIPAFERRK
jgi:hypothetical protein